MGTWVENYRGLKIEIGGFFYILYFWLDVLEQLQFRQGKYWLVGRHQKLVHQLKSISYRTRLPPDASNSFVRHRTPQQP
jgi:hypothetical protein